MNSPSNRLIGKLSKPFRRHLTPKIVIAGNKAFDQETFNSDGEFHVGFWMIWESGGQIGTILPNEGIGVYACNLIKGILEANEAVHLTVVCRQSELVDLRNSLPQSKRLRILTEAGSEPTASTDGEMFHSETEPYGGIRQGLGRAIACIRSKIQQMTSPRWLVTYLVAKLGGKAGRLTFISLLPLLAAFHIVGAYAVTTARLALRLWRIFWHSALRLSKRFSAKGSPANGQRGMLRQAVDTAGCDVWCLPTVNTAFPSNLPTVLLLDGLIATHFPKGLADEAVVVGLRNALKNSQQAAAVVTMTEYIHRKDLIGELGLLPDKARIVRPAYSNSSFRTLLPSNNESQGAGFGPFLYFPARNRSYKNLHLLIIALSTLRRKYKRPDLGMVLTCGGSYENLNETIALLYALDLQSSVRIILDCNRGDVTAFYRQCTAVVIPSFYEGIGLQFFEALEESAPLICSNIGTLREHAEHMGLPIPMFDPNDPDDMARVIDETLIDRSKTLSDQQEAYQRLAPRNWQTVGEEVSADFSAGSRRRECGPSG